MGDWTASATAKPSRGGGVSEQDGAHRLGGDAPAGELPAHGNGGLGCQAKLWSLRESNDMIRGSMALRSVDCEPDLPPDFRTIDKLRDRLPIRREQCEKDVFRR